MPKAKVGRPSKYKKDYCEQLIEHMAKGFSFESFAGKIRTTYRSLYTWTEKHDEFLQAKEIGQAANRLFWEDLSLKQFMKEFKDHPFNNVVWVFAMKNIHGWSDNPVPVNVSSINNSIVI